MRKLPPFCALLLTLTIPAFVFAQSAAQQKAAGDAKAKQLEVQIEKAYKEGRLKDGTRMEKEYNELMTKEYKDPPAPKATREPQAAREPRAREAAARERGPTKEPRERAEPRERSTVGPGRM